METHIPPEDPVLEWHAPQRLHHERGRAWYVIACIVVLACFVYSILSQALTFTFLIVAMTGIYWKTHTHPPVDRRMRIWKRGYAIDEDFTEWKDCKGYWMLRGRHISQITIEGRKGSPKSILTGPVSAFTLHELLPEFIEELPDHKESLLDFVIRILKI